MRLVSRSRVQAKPPAVRSFYMDLRGHVTKLGRSYEPKAGAKCDNYCKCVKWEPGPHAGGAAATGAE